MFEIQDAAKVITESVDPNAKIIFGTVRDEKLKKGEVKITVIASNFSDNFSTRKATSLFQTAFNSADEERPAKGSITTSTAGKIFNPPQPKETPKPVVEERKQDNKSANADDDDDWSAVPAFLRRSKLK